MTLVASIVLMGYNLHQLMTSYEAICEKVKEFKSLAQENHSDESSVRRSNFILTGVLSLVFVTLIYFSGLAYWIVGVVLAKMVASMVLSHLEISQIFREESIRPKFFKMTKVDAAVNVLVGLGIAVISVS
ncbi:hypothetical protein [uncultured Fibrobacter sp.]|uniref:hypothetical protein n=1 Tax=uncultured Fibrobacter sp. TaxID=261512 RepID=UPI00262B2D9A|nr:hypothetical protein [uncultured Fibrobacter sp.]